MISLMTFLGLGGAYSLTGDDEEGRETRACHLVVVLVVGCLVLGERDASPRFEAKVTKWPFSNQANRRKKPCSLGPFEYKTHVSGGTFQLAL